MELLVSHYGNLIRANNQGIGMPIAFAFAWDKRAAMSLNVSLGNRDSSTAGRSSQRNTETVKQVGSVRRG